MIVTLTDPSNNRKWQIRPFDNGLCYAIYKEPLLNEEGKDKKGREVKEPWLFTRKYPHTMSDAIKLTCKLMMNDPDNLVEISVSSKSADDISKEIGRFLKRVRIEVEKTD